MENQTSKCSRCRRALTSPESQAIGLGPVCAAKAGVGLAKTTRVSDGRRRRVSPILDLPVPDRRFRLEYENLNTPDKAFCTVSVYHRGGGVLIVATDESDSHGGTSITNRVERAMYLAWDAIGRPDPSTVLFAEHYRESNIRGPEIDFVYFDRRVGGSRDRFVKSSVYVCGRYVGDEFEGTEWKPFHALNPDDRELAVAALGDLLERDTRGRRKEGR